MSSSMTLVGRITGTPEMRFSAQGMAIVSFTIVTSRRVKDQASGEWSDVDTTFWDCKAFKQLAENVAGSLDKGMEVIAQGRAVQESWEDKQTGVKRSKIAVRVDEIGPTLRFATAKVSKVSGSGGQGQGWPARQGSGAQGGSDDPWSQSAPAGQGAGGWGGGGDEPPF